MKSIKVINKLKINSENYVNIQTGEILSSETPHIKSINIENKKIKIIDSSNYMIFDEDAFDYFKNILNFQDFGRIVFLSQIAKGIDNGLYQNNNTPHTKETLAVELLYNSKSKFITFMKKLHRAGVIGYLDIYRQGIRINCIVLNPYFARSSKTFSLECISLFDSFLKKANKSSINSTLNTI